MVRYEMLNMFFFLNLTNLEFDAGILGRMESHCRVLTMGSILSANLPSLLLKYLQGKVRTSARRSSVSMSMENLDKKDLIRGFVSRCIC